MSELAIKLSSVMKYFQRFQKPGLRIWHSLGFPIPSRYYETFVALQDIDLKINKGEKVALIGRNGAGKSTLLRLISGQILPNTGHITVHGKIQALMELGTGFHPDFTGIQNIRAALAFQAIRSSKTKTLIDEIIDFTELENFIHRPVREYSSGMYARLAFAVATCIRPEILIIDEILAAGDAYFVGKCIVRMKQLTTQGTTVLLVSHDLSSAQMICDRAIWIEQGKIQADGDILPVSKLYLASIRADEEKRNRIRSQLHDTRQNKTQTLYKKNILNIDDSENTADTSPDPLSLKQHDKKIDKSQNITDFQILTPVDRYGSGSLKITSFGFFDDNNVRRHTLISGESAIAIFNYCANEIVIEPIAVIAIYRPDGTCALQVTSNRSRTAIGSLFGSGMIRVNFTPLLLGPGDYFVSVALFKELNLAMQYEPDAYDLHDRCYILKILPPYGIAVEIGIVNQPVSWEVVS